MIDFVATAWDSLWGSNPWSGRLIVLAILAVLARSVYEGRRQSQRYRREERELRRVASWLEEWRAGSVPSAAEDEPSDSAGEAGITAAGEAGPSADTRPDGAATTPPHRELIDLDRFLEPTDPNTLVGDRLRAIARLRHHRVKVDVSTLQDLAVYRDAAAPGHGLPAFATGLCMLLGILGTFVGLSAMVRQIHLGLPTDPSSLTVDSWLASVQQLATVLGGMKTAFSTSLVGMAGAIVCSTIAFRLGRLRRSVFEGLERLTAAELIPATVPSVEDEVLLAQVSRQLDDSFSRLDEIYRQNQAALADLTAAQQAFVAIVDEVRSITRGQAARNLDAVLGQLAQSNEAVLEVSRQIPGIVKAFQGTARSLREAAAPQWGFDPPARPATGPFLGLQPKAWIRIFAVLAAVLGLAYLINAL